MIRSMAVLAMLCVLTGWPAAGMAEGSQSRYADWEIPDEVYVRRECETLRSKISRHVPDEEADQATRVQRRRALVRIHPIPTYVLSEIDRLCSPEEAGTLSGDAWLPTIDRLSQAIDDLYSCGTCATIRLPERMPLPDGFETYTLFLVPGGLRDTSEIAAIHSALEAYKAFGAAIGDERAAIWFAAGRHREVVAREREQPGERSLDRGSVDVLRSKAYCDRFGLNYNDGPYVVTTRRRPDQVGEGDEKVVVRLSGLPMKSIVRVLNILEQDLRMEREIRKRALLFTELKERLLGAAATLAQSFGGVGVVVAPARASVED